MTRPAGCELLAWDSAFFGLKIGRISGVCTDPELLRSARDWGRAEGLDCIYALLDGSQPLLPRSAAESGFNLFDLRVTLHARAKPWRHEVARAPRGRCRRTGIARHRQP